MQRTLIKSNKPRHEITCEEILRLNSPLIGFANLTNAGVLIPRHFQGINGKESADCIYTARSVLNFGSGNGWNDATNGMTLREWVAWLCSYNQFEVFVFDTEKELFAWLAEKAEMCQEV